MSKTQKIVLIIWALIIIAIFFLTRGLTAEQVVNYTPDNLYLCAMVMMVLFALKSLSVVIYSGILYSAIAVMFPPEIDFLICILGTVVAVTIPFFIGRRYGHEYIIKTREKYPKLNKVSHLVEKSNFLFVLALRLLNLPMDIESTYLGALHIRYPEYLLASIGGEIPLILICLGIFN